MENQSDSTIILFGATGDLARRKLIPAIYKLIKSGYLKKILLIGVAIDESTLPQIFENAQEFIDDYDQKIVDQCCAWGFYQQLDISNQQAFAQLAQEVYILEKELDLSGNRLVYCSVTAQFFVPIVQHATAAGLLTCKKKKADDGPWQRVVFEKPFGDDLASAQEMYKKITECLSDDQIYIIDHYLAKEIVENIALIRFTNRIFEPLWSAENIDKVTITLKEKLDVSMRIPLFERFGVLKDVVQNHMFQLLALIGMEEPKNLTGDSIRVAKADLLEKVKFESGFLGRYEGYAKHKGVAKDSKVATYSNLQFSIDNERWKGVEFNLVAGKCLKEKETCIEIEFKAVKCLLTHCPSNRNKLKISIIPRAGFTLELNAKKVGAKGEVIPVDMEFCHECIYGLYTPTAYETILQEVIEGMRSISVSFEEIESSWKLISDIEAKNLPMYPYECGSDGPKKEES
ncbi:MAG TPA: glucose-6-phosphate dehydrogenase [Candidatus Babeliales bacterium]|nr:glucose-6-phosphate dehydrogenase [Candidatus Babeliales bacterium]